MNEVWAGFSADPHLEPMEVAPCPYYPTMKDLDHRISDMIENIHKQQQMLRVAKETRRLMIEIRGACCGFNLDKDGSTLCHKYRKYLENGVVDKAGMMDCACMYLSAMLQGLGEA